MFHGHSLFSTQIQKLLLKSYWHFVEGIRMRPTFRLTYKNMSSLQHFIWLFWVYQHWLL